MENSSLFSSWLVCHACTSCWCVDCALKGGANTNVNVCVKCDKNTCAACVEKSGRNYVKSDSCAVSANQAWRSIAIRPRWSCDCEELMDSTSAAQFAKKCGFLVA